MSLYIKDQYCNGIFTGSGLLVYVFLIYVLLKLVCTNVPYSNTPYNTIYE